ncbi:dienelactone hydrolase family protein [Tsuneonella sp. HG222]
MIRAADDDMLAAIGDLRTAANFRKVAAIGWCYGGRITCIARIRNGVDAVVGYYPTAFETRLDLIDSLSGPLQLHMAEIEQLATRPNAIEVIAADCAGHAQVDLTIYSGAMHGFGFLPPHQAYDQQAARLAATHTALFLQHLLEAVPSTRLTA